MPEFQNAVKRELQTMTKEAGLPSDFGFIDSPSAQESLECGRALRKTAPRKSFATWKPAADRPDPVELLVGQGTSRLQELLPIRYERMGASPFTFYRGNALGMASDLASATTSTLTTQICGDAHVANFGGFAAPDRRLVFDINDFDETHVGPWEWDVARLAASLEICGRDRGFDSVAREQVVRAAVERYCTTMDDFAHRGNLDVWYARLELESLLKSVEPVAKKRAVNSARKGIEKAKAKDSARAVTKLTHVVDGKLRIVSQPPLIVPLDDLFDHADRKMLEHAMRAIITLYRQSLPFERRFLIDKYNYVDTARKVVGVGSVGTRCWIIVLEGRDGNDPLVLQVKEAEASVLERFTHRSAFPNHGQRVVNGQCLMQAASDPMLGWVAAPGIDRLKHDFYVRQLWDWKTSPDLTSIGQSQLCALGKMCGWTLARAHARGGDRFTLAGYLGRGDAFTESMAKFAATYADVNERDFDTFTRARKEGRLG